VPKAIDSIAFDFLFVSGLCKNNDPKLSTWMLIAHRNRGSIFPRGIKIGFSFI